MDTTRLKSRKVIVPSVLAATAAVTVAVLTLNGSAEDTQRTVPYTDSQSGGGITLCSAGGSPVTQGKVTDRPFAAIAIGETGVPTQLDPQGAVGTLFAHQPRIGVGPDEYSGSPLTAASPLVDPDRPGVPVGKDSWSIADFVTAFPAEHDGYVQLRMVLGTPAAGTLQEVPYDTVDIRVDGDTWEVVRGGSASCTDAPDLVPDAG